MRTLFASITAALVWAVVACSQNPARPNYPQPPVVNPGQAAHPPADAVVLFDGKNVSGWTRTDGSPTGCKAERAEMVCATGAGDAVSKETFRDAQIHIEFNIPSMPDQTGQRRGNSGVFLHGCYEIQVLDSWENPTYADGSCGGLYGIAPPLVNARRKPGEGQSYDVVVRTPRCAGDVQFSEPGSVTAFHNGILIHDRVKLMKPGNGCSNKTPCQGGPLRLQDHSGFKDAPNTVMRFRNIWIRRLPEAQ
jgi:hypothetical protein